MKRSYISIPIVLLAIIIPLLVVANAYFLNKFVSDVKVKKKIVAQEKITKELSNLLVRYGKEIYPESDTELEDFNWELNLNTLKNFFGKDISPFKTDEIECNENETVYRISAKDGIRSDVGILECEFIGKLK